MPDSRKILVRRRGGFSFESVARATQLHEEWIGAQWNREFVHQFGDYLSPIDGDGTCPACRKGARCRKRSLGVVDLRRAKPQPTSVRAVEEKIYRDQLQEFYARLPEAVHDLIGWATWEVFGEVAHFCGGQMPHIDLTNKEKARELFEELKARELSEELPQDLYARYGLTLASVQKVRSPEELAIAHTRAFDDSEPQPEGFRPRHVIESPETHLADCKAGCASALEQLPRALDYCLQDWTEATEELRSATKKHIIWSWTRLCEAWLRRVEKKLLVL